MKTFELLLFTIFVFQTSISAQYFPSKDIDAFINHVMIENKLPGLSIAIVKDDSIIFSKGYGLKKIGEANAVNEHTLFQSASITKTLTALLMGMLVDEGKVKWTDPVKKFIPEFELSEPYITEKLTIRDLLTFRSGILNGDTLKAESRKEIIPKLKNLKVTNSFRIGEVSFNLGYTLTGYIVEQLFGKSYEELVKEKLFLPLGMNQSYFDNSTATNSSNNFSFPHVFDKDKVVAVQREDFGIYAPAGCLISNVIDISKIVHLVFNEGSVNGNSIIKKETLTQMQKPLFLMGDSWKELFNPSTNFLTTGFGFIMSDYKGYKLVEMDGAATGTSNTMTMIPSKKIGVVIQTNLDWAFDALVKIKFKVIDLLLAEN
jgi:CubicO group peptidase (beta-lactamase class C family)